MKISDLKFPSHVEVQSFNSRNELAHNLTSLIQDRLKSDIDKQGQASLAVSGGSTPIPLFGSLSQTELDWSNITITLVDDRWVEPTDPASNEQLVKNYLLVGTAEPAKFIGFWQPNASPESSIQLCREHLSALTKPLTTVVLGMGNDGHTASLFPCAKELNDALNSTESCAVVTPETAPHQRVTLTPQRLLNSQLRVLHICGKDKLETLATALAGDDPHNMPIRLFLNHPLTIFWSP